MAMVMILFAALTLPSGIDPRHVPLGSPLGSMPIVAAPGESAIVLQAPLTEKQWLAERHAAMARSMKDWRAQRIARRVAEINREQAVREATESGVSAGPH